MTWCLRFSRSCRHKKWPSLGKRTICCLGFCCYQSFLVSSSHYAWDDHINHLAIKANHTSSRFIHPCLVTRQMFQSMFDQTWRIVYIFLDISLFFFIPSLIVKSLPIWDFSCQTCFCQILWQFGTEFLCFPNLTLRFVFTQSFQSVAAICSACKWILTHLVEFQCTEKNFC